MKTRRSSVFRFVVQGQPGLSVDHQGANKRIGPSRAGHLDGNRQDAGYPLLQVENVWPKRLAALGGGASFGFVFFDLCFLTCVS
jgi:hypothetical protein